MFRFTIRDVLWLMVVVGLAVGWWLNDIRWQKLVAREGTYHVKQRSKATQLELELRLKILALEREISALKKQSDE